MTRRTLPLLATCFLLLLVAVPAAAEDRAPTPEELAAMILDGNDAEQALVLRWLEGAEREELLQVFAALRERRAARAEAPAGKIADQAEPITLVQAEVRLIDVDAARAAAFLGKLRPTAASTTTLLTQEDAHGLLERVAQEEAARLITAPRLTVHDGQQANVSVVNQISFVQDYDMNVAEDGSHVADPIIGTLQEGVVIDLEPVVAAATRTIRVSFEGTFSSVQRPIPEKEIELAGTGGKRVTVQLPQVDVARLKVTVNVPDGGWVLLGSGVPVVTSTGGRAERVALLHVSSRRVGQGFLDKVVEEGIRLR